MINNAVGNGREIIGYRCRQCGGVFQSMFDETCNGCSSQNRQHEEMVKALTKIEHAELKGGIVQALAERERILGIIDRVLYLHETEPKVLKDIIKEIKI